MPYNPPSTDDPAQRPLTRTRRKISESAVPHSSREAGIALFPDSHDPVIHRVDAKVAGGSMVSQPVGSPIFNLHYSFNGVDSQPADVDPVAPVTKHVQPRLRSPGRQRTMRGGLLRNILGRFLADRTDSESMDVDPAITHNHPSASSTVSEINLPDHDAIHSHRPHIDTQGDFSMVSIELDNLNPTLT